MCMCPHMVTSAGALSAAAHALTHNKGKTVYQILSAFACHDQTGHLLQREGQGGQGRGFWGPRTSCATGERRPPSTQEK